MQTSNGKSTLLKRFSNNRWFSKIRAALPKSAAPGVTESETEQQLESFQAYSTTNEYRMAQLEAEAKRARAQKMAYRFRRK